MKFTKKIMIIKKSKRSNMCTNKEILIFIGVISILLYIERVNIVYCGITPTIETIRTGLQEFVGNLTDEEVQAFAHRLRFPPNQEGTFQPEVEEYAEREIARINRDHNESDSVSLNRNVNATSINNQT